MSLLARIIYQIYQISAAQRLGVFTNNARFPAVLCPFTNHRRREEEEDVVKVL